MGFEALNGPAWPATSIDKIEVTGLFGDSRYTLQSQSSPDDDIKLLILYGDNGSGKSTILKLVFHLLNPEPFNGHRTYVSSVPFRRIKIELSNTFVIEAIRKDAFESKDYQIVCHLRGETILVWEWRASADIKGDREYLRFCGMLEEQQINVHFLDDSRRVSRKPSKRMMARSREDYIIHEDDLANNLDPGALVNEVIRKTLAWFGAESISATNEGQSSANAMYVALINQFVKDKGFSEVAGSSSSDDIVAVLNRLRDLQLRSEEFSRYGLTANLDTSKIQELVKDAEGAGMATNLLQKVLRPYIDGHTARLDALANIQEIVHTFATTLADFYQGKSISLQVGKFFTIKSKIGRSIKVEDLSSGEKHLLLLFCNTILSRVDGTVLIVDEPELSLNIKWQRKLIDSMKSCMSGIKGQLIIATHSFEILAPHDYAVQQLINQEVESN